MYNQIIQQIIETRLMYMTAGWDFASMFGTTIKLRQHLQMMEALLILNG
jgi:hypothetical protein